MARNIERWLARPDHPLVPPVEYAGQWIAWDEERTKIVAHGMSLAEVEEAAKTAGYDKVVFQKVPPVDAVFIGAA